jgi:prolyl-tRNA synthetase
MRWTELLTAGGAERDASTDLLAAAGYTHRLADGLYTLLPLGQRVLQRINAIIRSEVARVGAQEVTLPLLQPAELWSRAHEGRESRADAFGPQLLRVAATSGEPLVLAPTHEEVAAIVGSACIRDERDLPRIAFQIQPRFRNQACSVEDGLLHTREFVMADAYSFHADRASLDTSYAAMRGAFAAIAAECGVSARFVAADGGAIGGDESEELVAPLPTTATEAAVFCSTCGYAASIEVAEFARARRREAGPAPATEVVAGDAPEEGRLAWVPFVARGRIVLGVFPRGLLLSPVKLAKALARAAIAAPDLHPASARELSQLGATYDSISLVRTPRSILIVADDALRSEVNFCIPSPSAGHFLTNLNTPRDFRVDLFADICAAQDGTACSRCGHVLSGIRGVEVGHIFKLGTHYVSEFGARTNGQPLQMGCYGLGVTRLMATIVEQLRDRRGIVWPEKVAPFLVVVVPAQPGACAAALELYRDLSASGVDVLLDDSQQAPAEKTRRAEWLGIPFQIVLLTDDAAAGAVELRRRGSSEVHRLSAADARARMYERRPPPHDGGFSALVALRDQQ